jgi:uncharacterized protein
LKIDLADIAGTPGARGQYSVSEDVAPTENLCCIGPVVGELEVENSGSLLLVRGSLRATAELKCVRCLGSFQYPLEISFEEEFATGETEPGVSTMDRDEPEASGMADFVLDVSELVRQQLLLNAPMASVCQEACRGICPTCGQNLNEGGCECAREPMDGRWARLAELLPRETRDGKQG